MIFNISKPHNSLKQYINCYWLIEDNDGLNEEIKILPNGAIEIILHLKTPLQRLVDKEYVLEKHFFIEGQQTKSLSLLKKADVKTFGITLFPWALKKMYNLSADLFTNKIYSLSEICSDLKNFPEHIIENASFQSLKESADLYFINLIKSKNYKISCLELNIINLYTKNKLDSSHSELSIGRRQLEIKTKQILGIPLRTAIKKNKIKNAIYHLITENHLSLTEIAYQGGYFDQAHFNRDVKTFFGVTPSHIRKNKECYSHYFSSI